MPEAKITVYLTATEAAAIRAAAEAASLPVSAWLRMVALETARKGK